MQRVIADTGVWYALCDARDPMADRAIADDIADRLEHLRVVVPWPTLYETLRTRFVKKAIALSRFERLLKAPNVEIVDDLAYREDALALAFESSLRGSRPLSMVDCLIRLLIDDVEIRVAYLATFNQRDFVDVCRRRRVEFLVS